MKKVMLVFGTRPEAIKMCPLVKEFQKYPEEFETIKKKLEDSHITVDMSYVPQFDDDLIDEYYENIRQGWWQEVFCRDVHFAGSDGILYKNALLDFPNRPEYRWAFYR